MSGVSIHAPARGATQGKDKFNSEVCVSIHAPARGATLQFYAQIINREFQSTHPHGVRHQAARSRSHAQGFNPRTRTGCDDISSFMSLSDAKFQSTHPHGVRRIRGWFPAAPKTFQSTHPHGVRLSRAKACSCFMCFNPRTRTGCDGISSRSILSSSVSIHAPARGATCTAAE